MAKGIHVLQLGTDPKSLFPTGPDRHIGIAPQAPLLHLAITDLEILEDTAQDPEIVGRLLRGSKVRGTDDLDQRHPGPVEVHQAKLACLHGFVLMDEFARILFHVDPNDTDSLGFPICEDLHIAIFSQRHLVLGYLIALWQVWIEVVLSRKKATPGNRGIGGQTHLDRKLDDFAVDYGKGSRKARAYRARMRIGLCPKSSGTGAEDLRFG